MTKPLAIYFFYFAISLLFSLGLTPLVRLIAFRLGALDRGGKGRRIHRGVVPRLGGLVIIASFFSPVIFSLSRGEWDPFHHQMTGILIASFFIFLIGVYDDIRGASILARLLVEAGAATVVYLWGIRITAFSSPFGNGILHLGWLALPVTLFWIVAITNAFNFIDGLDGLAAGSGIFVSLSLFFLNLGGDLHVSLVLAALIGGLGGFLIYNFPPASIFLGDSGSLLLGFFLGSFSILSSFKATAVITMMIPIMAFAVPLIDMAYAVLRRFYRGLPLGEADREHIHHKLLDKGLTRRKALVILYALNGVAMLLVLAFMNRKFKVDFFLLILLVIAAILGLRLLGYLRFLDFFHENLQHFQVNRRRRYFSFLIKRFQSQAMKAKSWARLSGCLNQLTRESGFGLMEVHLAAMPKVDLIYRYGDSHPKTIPIELRIPIVESEHFYGWICIYKEMDEDGVLCTAELSRTLSMILGHFIARHGRKWGLVKSEGESNEG